MATQYARGQTPALIATSIAGETRLEFFPQSFKEHRQFNDLLTLCSQIRTHPAMRVRTQPVLENMVRASLIFTVCFYGNLLALVNFTVGSLRGRNAFAVRTDTTFLHLILELAAGELATKNIETNAQNYAPHYVAMLEAAQEAGIDTSVIEEFIVRLKEPDSSVEQICSQLPLITELQEYLTYSDLCTNSFDDAFATIALRELFLAEPFSVIAASLPTTPKYARYKTFLTTHVSLDCGEHGILMAEALTNVTDVDRSISTMTEFLRRRKKVYDACLSEKHLY